MEALDGFENKFHYSIIGHSGDSSHIEFISYGNPPKSIKERLKIIENMNSHAQYCGSGDTTIEASSSAVCFCYLF
jgi:hypothetical protein